MGIPALNTIPSPILPGNAAGPLTHSLKMTVLLVPSMNEFMLTVRVAAPSQSDVMYEGPFITQFPAAVPGGAELMRRLRPMLTGIVRRSHKFVDPTDTFR